MANRTLSDLPVVTTPAAADILHLRQSLTDKSISMSLVSQFSLLNSDNSPTVESVTGTTYVINSTPRKRLLIADVASNCTLTFPGTYSEGYEIIIQNAISSTGNVIGLPSGDICYPGQEIVFIWNGSAFVKRSFLNHTISNTSNPSVVPDFIGQKYINTSSNVIFIATGDSSSSDWKDIINTLDSILSITDSNYTILDTDGYTVIEVTKTTSSGSNTITLPTVADNAGRKITIKLIQGSTGPSDYLVIDGESTDTIDGEETFNLNGDGDFISLYSNGVEWKKTGFKAHYITQTIERSDWTNVHLGSDITLNLDSSVNHNLGCGLYRLKTRVLLSPTSDISGAIEIYDTTINSDQSGITFYNLDNNNIVVQTGNARVIYLSDSGLTISLSATTFYYTIVVERMF